MVLANLCVVFSGSSKQFESPYCQNCQSIFTFVCLQKSHLSMRTAVLNWNIRRHESCPRSEKHLCCTNLHSAHVQFQLLPQALLRKALRRRLLTLHDPYDSFSPEQRRRLCQDVPAPQNSISSRPFQRLENCRGGESREC